MKLSVEKGELLEDVTVYRCIVGSLIYMTITKPDFTIAPRKPHLDAARHILRYVKSTLQYELFYETECLIQEHGYINADWASSISDRRSTSGFMFSLRSATISWSNKKQPIVALSSTDVECKGAAMATCEVAWLRSYLLTCVGQYMV